jgi:hypothetical protein
MVESGPNSNSAGVMENNASFIEQTASSFSSASSSSSNNTTKESHNNTAKESHFANLRETPSSVADYPQSAGKTNGALLYSTSNQLQSHPFASGLKNFPATTTPSSLYQHQQHQQAELGQWSQPSTISPAVRHDLNTNLDVRYETSGSFNGQNRNPHHALEEASFLDERDIKSFDMVIIQNSNSSFIYTLSKQIWLFFT